MENNRMVRTAAVLDKAVNIVGGIFRVCGFVCLVFAVLVLVLGEAVFVPDSNTLELGFVEFMLNRDYQSITAPVKAYAFFTLLASAAGCFIMYFIMKHLRSVLSSVKEGRPFESGVVLSFRRLGILTLAGGLVREVCGWGQQLLMLRAYPMEEIFSSPAISGIHYNFIMDMGFVLIALVFFFLSWIFSYGHQLQKQSDETL